MLASENRDTLKSASLCLGIIAAFEVPDGHWDEFLQIMGENAMSENRQFALAATQSLGFLSEFLEYIDKTLTQE